MEIKIIDGTFHFVKSWIIQYTEIMRQLVRKGELFLYGKEV